MTDALELLDLLVRSTVYSEGPSQLHQSIITKVFAEIIQPHVPAGTWVLDIGAGDGFAMELFKQSGYPAVGLNFVDEDIAACEAKGLICEKGDMHRLEFADKTFGYVHMRHILEHSPFPMLALAEAKRVLKDEGWLYVEVPMPETPRSHETNPNHWALFSQVGWVQMFLRSAFSIVAERRLEFTMKLADDPNLCPDVYCCWLLQKL